MAVFRDRQQAGRALARQLQRCRGRADVVVVGLPRGGVPVAAEVAADLGAPLDVLVVRKIGHPNNEEVAVGAIASGGGLVVNDLAVDVDVAEFAAIVERERVELSRRERLYRGARPPLDVNGRVVVVVDDGIATGASLRVAAEAVRKLGPRRLIVAAPVGARDACAALVDVADDVVVVVVPDEFSAVGRCYDDFHQVDDDEVRALLSERSSTGARP